MAKLGVTLKSLFKTAGIDPELPEYKDLMALDIELPDAAQDALYNNLYNDFGVRNNDKFKKHFTKEVYDGMDGKTKATAKKFKFSDDEISELEKITNSFERVEKMISMLNDKAAAAVGADKKALLDEIKKKDDEIVKVRDEVSQKEKAMVADFRLKQLGSQIDTYLNGKSYYNEDIPKPVHLTTAKTLINEALKAKGAQMVMTEEGQIKLVQAANPELEYTEQNKPVAFNDYADRVLAENKLLKTSTPSGGGGNPNPNPVPPDPNLKPDLEGMDFYAQQKAAAVAQN